MSITVPAWTLASPPALSGSEVSSARATETAPSATHHRHFHTAHFGSWTLRNATPPRTPRSLSKPKPARRSLAKVTQPWSGDDTEGGLSSLQPATGTENEARRIEATDAKPGGYDSERSDSDERQERGTPDRVFVMRRSHAEDGATGQSGLRLAQVKQALIDRSASSITANKTGPATANYYLLLPLELLNAARPRTAAQSEAARGRLALLARASIGVKA
jgi:hypothetical protein